MAKFKALYNGSVVNKQWSMEAKQHSGDFYFYSFAYNILDETPFTLCLPLLSHLKILACGGASSSPNTITLAAPTHCIEKSPLQ